MVIWERVYETERVSIDLFHSDSDPKEITKMEDLEIPNGIRVYCEYGFCNAPNGCFKFTIKRDPDFTELKDFISFSQKFLCAFDPRYLVFRQNDDIEAVCELEDTNDTDDNKSGYSMTIFKMHPTIGKLHSLNDIQFLYPNRFVTIILSDFLDRNFKEARDEYRQHWRTYFRTFQEGKGGEHKDP